MRQLQRERGPTRPACLRSVLDADASALRPPASGAASLRSCAKQVRQNGIAACYRQSEIEEKLDLTKNQAPNQLEAAENTEASVQVEQPDNTETIKHKPARSMKV